MIRLRTRQLWLQAKDFTLQLADVFSKGTSFEALFMATVRPFTSRLSPQLAHGVEAVAVYFLFHLFALFVIILTGINIFVQNTQLKGRRITPKCPDFSKIKERLAVWIVTMVAMVPFVSQLSYLWPTTTMVSIPSYLINWVPAIRPQINIKPQVKVVPPSTSASSSAQSLVSVQMKSVKPGLKLGIEPADKDVAKMLKKIQNYADGAIAGQQIVETLSIADRKESETYEDAIDCFDSSDESDLAEKPLINGRPSLVALGSDSSDTDMESEI